METLRLKNLTCKDLLCALIALAQTCDTLVPYFEMPSECDLEETYEELIERFFIEKKEMEDVWKQVFVQNAAPYDFSVTCPAITYCGTHTRGFQIETLGGVKVCATYDYVQDCYHLVVHFGRDSHTLARHMVIALVQAARFDTMFYRKVCAVAAEYFAQETQA